jgi:GrpB-like predicted nucleotidyltransferase (UPF0157 family)
MRTIKVVSYDPAWQTEYAKAHTFLTHALQGIPHTIEHVGSTSVPGLAAKPILDIDIIVATPALVQQTIQRLATVGYQHRGNLGIPGREAFAYDPANPHITWLEHHLYLCLAGTESLTNHLLLRDHLRANPQAAQAYGDLKKQLAQQFPHNIDAYIEGKTALITQFLAQAGMQTDSLERITAVNQQKDPPTP